MSNMFKKLWSDNVIISDHEGWFVASELNMLFKMDLRTGECQYLLEFPDSDVRRFRMNQVQEKYGKNILCLPDKGSRIWIYDILSEELREAGLLNVDNMRAVIVNSFIINETLFVVASERKQIIEMKWKNKFTMRFYDVFDHIEQGNLGNESILIDHKIYCVCDSSNQICEFNVRTKKVSYFSVQGIVSGLATICYDGTYFWLSGFSRELYIWDKENATTRVLDSFPLEFGSYEIDDSRQLKICNDRKVSEVSLFSRSINGKDAIWFIPFQTNHIIYVDKISYEFKIFAIPNEIENIDSWCRGMNQKYLVEYVRKGNTLGLYSLKNNVIVEVNIEQKEISQIPLFVRESDKVKIWNIFFRKKSCYWEGDEEDLLFMIKNKENLQKQYTFSNSESIGSHIFSKLVKDSM